MRDITIHVRFIHPPIPDRQFDWCATYDHDEPDDEGNMPAGYGKTPSAALGDLLEIIQSTRKHNMPNTTGGGPYTKSDERGEKADDDLWGDIIKPAVGALADLKQAGDTLVARLPDVEFGGLLDDSREEIIGEICSELEDRGMSWGMIDKARAAMRKVAGLTVLT